MVRTRKLSLIKHDRLKELSGQFQQDVLATFDDMPRGVRIEDVVEAIGLDSIEIKNLLKYLKEVHEGIDRAFADYYIYKVNTRNVFVYFDDNSVLCVSTRKPAGTLREGSKLQELYVEE